MVVPVLACEGRFRSFLTGYVELVGGELLTPLFVGFLDVVRHGLWLDWIVGDASGLAFFGRFGWQLSEAAPLPLGIALRA